MLIKFFVVGMVLLGTQARGNAIVQKTEQVEVNWTTGKFRVHGLSKLEKEHDADWKAVEQRAWRDGIGKVDHLLTKTPWLNQNKGASAEIPLHSQYLGKFQSVTSTYSASGELVVLLESSFFSLLSVKEGLALNKTGVPQQNAVVVQVEGKSSPCLAVTVKDKIGNIVGPAQGVFVPWVHKKLPQDWEKSPHFATKTTLAAKVSEAGVIELAEPQEKLDAASLEALKDGRFVVIMEQ